MTATQFFTRITGAYLLLNLLVSRLLGVPFTPWLTLVFICLVSLAIFARLERRRSNQGDELQQLIDILALEQRTWTLLEHRWVGRTVRLKDDICNPTEPEGHQVYVQAGTPGKIVALNRDQRAPFTVLFPGFTHKVRVGLDKLDVRLDEGRIGTVPVRPPASAKARLRDRDSLTPPMRHPFAEDEDDTPGGAEAFACRMADFAALDWILWNDTYLRSVYHREMHYQN